MKTNRDKSRPLHTAVVPQVIHPSAVFSVDEARAALKLAKATIGREVRLGRLRVSKRGGRYYILGRWLLEWIEGGELKRTANPASELCTCINEAIHAQA